MQQKKQKESAPSNKTCNVIHPSYQLMCWRKKKGHEEDHMIAVPKVGGGAVTIYWKSNGTIK